MAVLYDAAGVSIFPSLALWGAYFANINIRHTAADVAGSVVWAFRNPVASTKTVLIRNVRGRLIFDGVAAAGVERGYEFIKFTGGDPTTGVTVPRVKKRTGHQISQIADANIQQKSGVLTITGIAGIEIIHAVKIPIAVTNVVAPFDFDCVTAGTKDEFLEFAAGEGFGIRLATGLAATIGLGVNGSVEWEER